MFHDVREAWIDDAVSAGNFNVLIPLLTKAVANNTGLTDEQKKQFLRRFKRTHAALLSQTWHMIRRAESWDQGV